MRTPERILPDNGDFGPEEMVGERLPNEEELEAYFKKFGLGLGDTIYCTYDPNRKLIIKSFGAAHKAREPFEPYILAEDKGTTGVKTIILEEIERGFVKKV